MRRRGGLLAAFAGALVLAAVLIILYRFLEHRGEFDLRRISVWGCRRVDSTSVAPALVARLGRPVTGMSTDSLEADLEAVSGIDSAEVWLVFPDGVGVELKLLEPVLVLSDGIGEVALTGGCEPLPPTFLSDTLTRVVMAGGDREAVLPGLAAWAEADGIPGDVELILVEPDGAVAVVSDGMRVILGYSDFGRRMDLFLAAGGRGALRDGWAEADARFDGQLILRENPSLTEGVSL